MREATSGMHRCTANLSGVAEDSISSKASSSRSTILKQITGALSWRRHVSALNLHARSGKAFTVTAPCHHGGNKPKALEPLHM